MMWHSSWLSRAGCPAFFSLALLGIGCGTDGAPRELAPLADVTLTDEAVIVPDRARTETADMRNPSRLEFTQEMLDEGFGDYTMGPGESHQEIVVGGGSVPPDGSNARLLTRFVHLPDIQLIDDEAVTRVAGLDAPGLTSSASRAQDAYTCQMLNAMVRTINGVHRESPLDFVLLGGDNIDNAASNELEWALQLLGSGGEMECDSGEDDDIRPGPNNDPKDPFVAVGLDIPYYWVNGNHDVLIQGNFVVNAVSKEESIGNYAPARTRDWANDGLFSSRVPADAAREALNASEVIDRVIADGSGHGLGAEQAASDRATYAFDVPGTPLRFIAIDTTARTGGASGLLNAADIAILQPLLDAAVTDGKWVVLTAHHAASSLTTNGGTFGTEDPTAIDSAAFVDFVTSYGNVVFSLVGHSHRHRLAELSGNGRTVPEVMTAAVSDFPHQSRVIEIWDQDNGWLRLRATCFDFATDGDRLAEEARRRGILDYTSGWADNSDSMITERNVDIYVPAPTTP